MGMITIEQGLFFFYASALLRFVPPVAGVVEAEWMQFFWLDGDACLSSIFGGIEFQKHYANNVSKRGKGGTTGMKVSLYEPVEAA